MKNPQLEGLKEVARWVVLFGGSFVISWLVTETLAQITNVPELLSFKVWVFTYSIPLRQLFTLSLTFLGRYIDKYLHEVSKQTPPAFKGSEGETLKGLLPF